jgi:hypothetical protein
MHMSSVAYQSEFRPALPRVKGPKDYGEFRETLKEIDRLLIETGIEERFVTRKINGLEASVKPKALPENCKRIVSALRHGIVIGLTGLSYRSLALRIADSALLQWFTHTAYIDEAKPFSKSSLQRYERMFSKDDIAEVIHELNQAMKDESMAEDLLRRDTAVRFDEIFADTTCVKANIHFPVDWVLLRDATRTLMKAVALIRSQGLRHRMDTPQSFMRKMNALCIEMTHTRKKKNGKKMRKMVLRRMKRLMKTVEGHARTYHQLLDERWSETGWSEVQAQDVLGRMKNILDQLPKAVHQAHERIIGERRVDNEDKILSLYEQDVRVIVRGKAGAEVEFGNGLYLAEQADGIIVDWEFFQGQAPSDSKLVGPSIKRITREHGNPASFTGDRGFDTKANRVELEELAIFNGICPRSVPLLQERLEDESFCRLQARRGSTEGRIAIFKNAFLGRPLRNKGFRGRQARIEWCILAHNLWKYARMAIQNRQMDELAAAAAA